MKQQHTLIVLLLQTTISFLGTQVVAQTPEPNNALGELRRIEAAIMKNLRRVEQATVCLQAGGGSGSAVIVSKDGLILTAAHVVEGHQTMTVRFADDRTVQCKVLGTYGPADAAMAQIIDKGEYVFAEIAAEGSVKQGDTIYALGNPSGFDPERGMPIRLGHIVTTEKNFFSCDASLIRGDSGGPSFNLDGKVVGIHSNISESVAVNNDAHIDAFHRHWQSMLAGEKKGRTLEPENAPDELVVGLKLLGNEPGEPIRIEQVIAETPAAWAQLETGDEIVRVNEITVTNAAEFLRKAKQNEWGRTLQLEVLRAGEKLQLRLELMTYAEVQAKRASSKQATPESPPRASAEPGDDKTEVFYKMLQEQKSKGPQQQKHDGDQEYGKKSELQRLMEAARKNGGRLKIDRNKLLELNARLGKRMNKLSPIGGRINDAWSSQFRQAFSEYASRYSRSLYPVMVTGRIASLAVVVSGEGYLVTKASEIEGRKFQVVIRDDVRREAAVIAIDRDDDLALLKIDPSNVELYPIDFAMEGYAESPKGTIVCCVNNLSDTLAGFGVVSVGARPLNGSSGAILGVEVEPNEKGLLVTQFSAGSPAQAAGIQEADVITDFDGKSLVSAEELTSAVAAHLPGEQVRLNVIRAGAQLSLSVTLGNRSKLAPMAGNREQDLDKISAKLSRRRWSFTEGIQHDSAIRPKDCGGLMVDLEGRVVGLNIARAGRIKSYALPASLVARFVQRGVNEGSEQ